MWTVNSMILVSLYIMEFVISLYTSISFTKYLQGRLRIGVISLFMLSIWLFFSAFSIQALVSVFMRIEAVYAITDDSYHAFLFFFWTLSHIGTATGLLLIGYLVSRKRFDIYITIKKGDDDLS